jgi:hypothetical protein
MSNVRRHNSPNPQAETQLKTVDTNLFRSLEAEFISQLVPKAFTRATGEVGGPFGSHFVECVRGEEAFRLIADGKESKVFVEYSPRYGTLGPAQEWQEVLSSPYPARSSGEAASHLRKCIALALGSHKSAA